MTFNPQFEKIGDILVYVKMITQDQIKTTIIEEIALGEIIEILN